MYGSILGKRPHVGRTPFYEYSDSLVSTTVDTNFFPENGNVQDLFIAKRGSAFFCCYRKLISQVSKANLSLTRKLSAMIH